MRNLKYDWQHGENERCEYYKTDIGFDHLSVHMDKSAPNIWFGLLNGKIIFDKTKNDRVRKKYNLPHNCPMYNLPTIHFLTNADPQYMMRKVERYYTHGLLEISE